MDEPTSLKNKLNPKYTVRKMAQSDVVDRIVSMDSETRLKRGAMVGAGLGLAKIIFDGDKDTLLDTAGSMAIGAGAVVGADLGAQWFLNETSSGKALSKEYTAAKIAEPIDNQNSKEVAAQEQKKVRDVDSEMKRVEVEAEATKIAQNVENTTKVTVSDIQRTKIEVDHEKAIKAQAKASAEKMDRWKGRAGIAGVVGLGAFALASVMDTSEGMSEDRRTSRMTEQQERNLTRKQNREKKAQQSQGYGNVDFGQMALDMFNERIGHHKMGNAKFQ